MFSEVPPGLLGDPSGAVPPGLLGDPSVNPDPPGLLGDPPDEPPGLLGDGDPPLPDGDPVPPRLEPGDENLNARSSSGFRRPRLETCV